METEYLDEEQVISLYNKVRTGKKTWPTGIWSSPAALQYAVTVFDYWIRNHLLRMWSAFQEAQAEHDKAERESAERFWAQLRLVRSSRGQAAEAWSIVNAEDERRGEVVMLWGEPHPYCVVVLDDEIEA